MRDILFRGKANGYNPGVEKGTWVYGNLIHMTKGYDKPIAVICPSTTYIAHGDICGDFWWVDIDTIGQDTGLLDKNGRKIFEGDILSTRRNGIETKKLKGYYGVDSEGYPQRVPGYEGSTEYHYSRQIDCLASVKFSPRHGFYLDGASVYVDAICNEIVGNIHDNPELLEVK